MSRAVSLTDKARSDLDRIHDRYRQVVGDPAATALVSTLLDTLAGLGAFPGRGRPSVQPGCRELVIAHLPYVAVYRVVKQQVQVLRVLHQRQARQGEST